MIVIKGFSNKYLFSIEQQGKYLLCKKGFYW